MNVTSQHIVNPKSRMAYSDILKKYITLHPLNTKLRLGGDRQLLSEKIHPHKKIKFKVDDISFHMIYCPKGEFKMRGGRNSFNLISIDDPFLFCETEVTQELFEKVMGYNPSKFQGEEYQNSKKMPVGSVAWYDAVMFCNRLSEYFGKRPYYSISNVEYGCYIDLLKGEDSKERNHIIYAEISIDSIANGFRLPFKNEWIYAAKAGSNNDFAGTNDPQKAGDFAWFEDNSEINDRKQTHPVKGKQPNEWGFYDMSGNMSEWVGDTVGYTNDRPNRIYKEGNWHSDVHSMKNDRWARCDSSGIYEASATYNYHNGFRIASSLIDPNNKIMITHQS